MRVIPNFFETKRFFEPYLTMCYQKRLFLEQGANAAYPGPYEAIEIALKQAGEKIDREINNLLSYFNEGLIPQMEYKQLLLMFRDHLINDRRFLLTSELNIAKIKTELDRYLN